MIHHPFKVLILGSASPGSIELFYQRGLESLGCTASIYDPLKNTAFYSRVSRVRRMFGDIRELKAINRATLEVCLRSSVDVVWVFKGVELLPELLISLKEGGKCLVCYNPDHPIIRTSVTHGGRNVEDCLPHYDIYFTFSSALASHLTTNGAWLPFGFDLTNEQFLVAKEQSEVQRACFVGTLDRARFFFLKELARRNFPIDIYGPINRYAKAIQSHGVRVFSTIFDQQFWSTLRRYRVQINLFRRHNIGSHNQRTFEVPAVGGVLLSPYSVEQEEFFDASNEISLYNSHEEFLAKLEGLLTMRRSLVLEMRDAARKRSSQSGYTYNDRANQAFCRIQEKLLIRNRNYAKTI